MAGEDKATRNLRRTAAKTADALLRLVRQAIRDADEAVRDALARPEGLTDAGRAEANAQIDALFRQRLKAKMEEALAALSGKAAEGGNAEAMRQAEADGRVVPRFSEEYLREYLSRITPANAPSLAAVFTKNLADGQKAALRAAAVETFRAAAAAGLTTRERMKLLQENWARQAGDTAGARFVDRAGRRWENARYVQMLARTTAQRVETAAFCDSMLRGGYPLARISNDGNADCGVCAEWEGRLIDLTAENEFKAYGAVPLRVAREAGVFHPNCVHRLAYLSPLDYPEGAYEAFAGRVGEPGAFGDPVKTNAGFETAKRAKARAAQAAKAARAKAKAGAKAALGPIGKTGTWKTLGLEPLKSLATSEGKPLVALEEAIARLRQGETVPDVFGNMLELGELARYHIMEAKKRPADVIKQRLANLDNVIETLKNPLEVWKSTTKPYTTYIALVRDKAKQKNVLHVVVKKGARVYSWHLNDREFEHGRMGTLIHRRPQ